jgi:hypothetical protein
MANRDTRELLQGAIWRSFAMLLQWSYVAGQAAD